MEIQNIGKSEYIQKIRTSVTDITLELRTRSIPHLKGNFKRKNFHSKHFLQILHPNEK